MDDVCFFTRILKRGLKLIVMQSIKAIMSIPSFLHRLYLSLMVVPK